MLRSLRSVLSTELRRHIGLTSRGAHNLLNYVATNEPLQEYLPGSDLRIQLDKALHNAEGVCHEVPIVIGDEEFKSDQVKYHVAPFDHQTQIAKFYYATEKQIQKAIEVNLKARKDWEKRPLEERCEIFLKAADMIAGSHRMDMMTTTMLGQGKTIVQGEIDCIGELVDFYRFNAQFAMDMWKYRPISPEGITNSFELRGKEGFWAAITPFNFAAIGGHLPGAAAMMGNAVLWKPSDAAILSNYTTFKILREAGLPPGVINFIPADGPVFGNAVTGSRDLAGIVFTGSVKTFQTLWKQVGQNIENYRTFPTVMGETGGKNFHFVHKSADVETVVNATIRSAFEYSGQKCSACSRMYVPQSLWPTIRNRLVEEVGKVKVGSPVEPENFLSAVIDDKSFNRIKDWIDYAHSSPNLSVLAGGTYDDSVGYYVQPTIIEAKDPRDKIMENEIFGPVLTVYVYLDDEYREALDLVNTTSPFSLTGSVFAEDRNVLNECMDLLKDAAGNFYLNDKSTGSVVNQQPFGGARQSGTNDKPGGPSYLWKFVSSRSIKESHTKQTTWKYPYMG